MSISNSKFHIGPDGEPDKYRLLRHVGSGGEAELWEADVELAGARERVAVKILNPAHDGDLETWRQRWAEQVDLLRLVKHPGVVGVHQYFEGPRMHRAGDVDPAQRVLCLVMQWIDGQDLRAWVPRHATVQDRYEALRHLGQIAAILDWLHSGKATTSSRPVIHGDISPANVIIDQDGQAVLVDFGFSRIARRITTMIAGTPGYCAPEVLRHGEYGPASDRYAFGALACYMLTGIHPPTDPVRLREGLTTIAGPAAEASMIDQLMTIFAEDPDSRPPAGEWIRILHLQSSTAPALSAPLPPLAPPATTFRRPILTQAGSWLTKLSRWTRQRPRWSITAASLIAVALVATLIGATALGPRTDPTDDTANQPSFNTNSTLIPSTPASTQVMPSLSPSSSPAPPPVVTTHLTDLAPVYNEEWVQAVVLIEGKEYQRGWKVDDYWGGTLSEHGDEAWLDFSLSGRFTRVKGIAGLTDDTPITCAVSFKIYLDDKVLSSYTIQLRRTAVFDLDTTGAIRLSFVVEDINNCEPIVALADARLERQR